MEKTYSKSNESKNVALVSLVPGKDSLIALSPEGQKTLQIGFGEKKDIDRRKFILLARQVIAAAKQHRLKKIAIDFREFQQFSKVRASAKDLATLLATSFEMANFEFNEYKEKPKEGWSFVEEVAITGKITKDVQTGFQRGHMIAQEINASRSLANTPGGDMTPQKLAAAAEKAAEGTKIKVTILKTPEIRKLKMGGVLGVSQGSKEEPRFVVMEYTPRKRPKNVKKHPHPTDPIVLVGKGVTFDTGGINIKPSEGMLDHMHMDMSGGAAVIHTIVAAAKLGVKKNIVALIPAVENMPSGSSYRPADIIKSMSGKTIEILNTDAEGRVILADALEYAKRYNPRLVVDVATLTGAAMVALGSRATALFTKDQALSRKIEKLGEQSGDYVWPLPLWDEYAEDIKGTFADIANSSKVRGGGAITAALFLYQFAKDYPWIHLDIAPRMISIEGEHLAKGSAGAPIRLLVELLEQH